MYVFQRRTESKEGPSAFLLSHCLGGSEGTEVDLHVTRRLVSVPRKHIARISLAV